METEICLFDGSDKIEKEVANDLEQTAYEKTSQFISRLNRQNPNATSWGECLFVFDGNTGVVLGEGQELNPPKPEVELSLKWRRSLEVGLEIQRSSRWTDLLAGAAYLDGQALPIQYIGIYGRRR